MMIQPNHQIICNAVSAFYGVSVESMLARGKSKSVAFARHVSMYLMRKHTPASMTEIGRLSGRDHSAVSFAVSNLTRRLAADPEISEQIAYIERQMEVA